MRRDKIMQHGKIIVETQSFPIEQIDNPEGKHQRIGIRSRESARESWVHAFFIVPRDAVTAVSTNNNIKVLIGFQGASEAIFEITPEGKTDLIKLKQLNRQDFNTYNQ